MQLNPLSKNLQFVTFDKGNNFEADNQNSRQGFLLYMQYLLDLLGGKRKVLSFRDINCFFGPNWDKTCSWGPKLGSGGQMLQSEYRHHRPSD